MTLRLRMQPIGRDVLDDLVQSGDLAQSVLEGMPTFTLHGAAVEWRPNEPTPRSLFPDDLSCPSGQPGDRDGDPFKGSSRQRAREHPGIQNGVFRVAHASGDSVEFGFFRPSSADAE
jgi:hypothetical protein